MESSYYLLEILEKSLKKNGDKTLTISHLINILKLADEMEEKNERELDLIGSDIEMELD